MQKIIILERYASRVDGERNESKIVLKILSYAREICTLKENKNLTSIKITFCSEQRSDTPFPNT